MREVPPFHSPPPHSDTFREPEPAGSASRFSGVSFAGIPARSPNPRGSGRFEALHFRGRNAPKQTVATETKMPVEIPPREGGSCEEETFAFELLRSAGLDPAGYRGTPLVRRLPACLRALRVPSVTAAEEVLAREPQKMGIALHALLIGTTSFFRDTAVFQCLGESVIPEMVARHPRPRVWSAACSSGLELYSVAMLLARQGALGQGQLLGSDCRSQSIAEAAQGIYPAEAALPVPPELATRYLIGGKASVAVAPAIHAAARWECNDLLKGEVPGPWDMIFCRNLAIYLKAGTAEGLWCRLAAALAPGGVLVVGKAEKPRLKGLARIGPCIYRKTPQE